MQYSLRVKSTIQRILKFLRIISQFNISSVIPNIYMKYSPDFHGYCTSKDESKCCIIFNLSCGFSIIEEKALMKKQYRYCDMI